MRNIRIQILLVLMLVTSIISVSPIAAMSADGGVSEVQSEPRSTINLVTASKPSAWKSVTFKMGPSYDYWKKVAQCETGGNWKDKGRFAGGLGIADTTWIAYGGDDFAPHPSQASIFEQIVVANRIAVFGYQTTDEFITFEQKQTNKPFFRPAVGFNGWGCIKNNDYLRPPKSSTFKINLPQGAQFYCPKYEKLFKKYALPWKVFSYIAWRESRCNPGAVNAKWSNGKIVWTLNSNGTYDSGLLQINSSWFRTLREQLGHQPGDLFDPKVNAMFASWILHFTSGRLSNWSLRASA